MPVPKRANPSAHNTPIQSYHIKVIETDMFNRGEPLVCNMANTQEPDFDNMTDDEIIAFFDEMEKFENHKWGIDEEE